jgi:glycosyltransferase involved in cell wall biosynthesis
LIPQISIVTPSYNQRTFIELALESVRSQKYASAEHIVVDGASTDGTVEYLRSLSGKAGWQHLRWISEPDQGQSDALNKGFKMASGDIIGWLNSDDVYRSGCFAAIISAFENNRAIDIVYGDTTWIDENSRIIQVRREIEFSRFVLAYHRVLYIPTTSTFFRRRIFDDGNWIDTSYDYAMDYEFFLRLTNAGYRFQHIPCLLADFRWHSENKSGCQSKKHLSEHDGIARMYSPFLRRMPTGILLVVARKATRFLAAGRRYSEKLLRGYYFEQYRSAPFRP